jgi:hypothetical protein
MDSFTVSYNGEEFAASIRRIKNGIVLKCPKLKFEVVFFDSNWLFMSYKGTEVQMENKFVYENDDDCINLFIRFYNFIMDKSIYNIDFIFKEKQMKSARTSLPDNNAN